MILGDSRDKVSYRKATSTFRLRRSIKLEWPLVASQKRTLLDPSS